MEEILKAITTLCIKVDSMDNEIQKLKTNEDNLKSKVSQQHDYKNAELRRPEDGKNPELKGDDGKLLKTHNVCLNTAAGVAAAKGENAKETTKKKAKAESKEKVEAVLVAKNAPEQGPSTKRKRNGKEDTKQDIINNLRVQNVLGGRVFDPTILKKPGMNLLGDLVEIQSWTHLFMTKSPVMHEDQVREFYYNVEFNEDGSLHTLVGDKRIHLNEELLGVILEVPREGIRSVAGKLCTKHFSNECSKLPDMHCAGIQKKLMKGEYQLLFEFVNKVALSRFEKSTVANSTDLFVMESLCKFDPLNLPAFMLEHMHKTVIERKGKHGMGFGYFLTKVFDHQKVSVGPGTVGTVKQSISLSTLVEYECIEGQTGQLSKMSQLVAEQDQLKRELEELTTLLGKKC
ncbi:hypothetical protein MTR67_003107 [Solanum verrucosum]|uniref:Uncharacterized protein n=1 Tax=Solanum verrucosum TaxID=315347 RepID=A0AAF0PS86_SOLVR|nr:hypothetical protein MTR67_003107 [Solanum verrucosum]